MLGLAPRCSQVHVGNENGSRMRVVRGLWATGGARSGRRWPPGWSLDENAKAGRSQLNHAGTGN